MEARRELIERQPVTFPFKFPGQRAAERQAQLLAQSQSLELRPDVPPFDPGNPKHLRAWEWIWGYGKRPSGGE